MARRKRSKNNKRRNTRKRKEIDLSIIGTIVFSVLLAVLLYTNSGTLGNTLNEVLGGMVGILRYIVPIGAFAIAVRMACKEEKDYITHKLIQYLALIIFIAIIMSIYQISKGALDISGDMSQIMKRAYLLGSKDVGGGVIGTLAAVPIVKMVGVLGAIVLCIGVSIMLFAFVFEIDVAGLISNMVEKHLERKEERDLARQEEIQHERELREKEAKLRNKQIRNQKVGQSIEMDRDMLKRQDLADKDREQISDQIKIKLNGKVIQEENENGGIFSKFKKNKKKENNSVAMMASSIIGNDSINIGNEVNSQIQNEELFIQEEQQKEDKTKQVLQLEHTIAVEEENYVFPPLKILKKSDKSSLKGGTKSLTETATKLQKTLYSFGVQARVEDVAVGPAITRYELKPAEGVRVSKIANLADDIALNLAAETIRIEAPIPGKQAVGIEVPNKEKEMVGLREVIESDNFQNNTSKLSIALGKDVAGSAVVADIAKMPHVLIAGSTGSGKSVCINTIVTSIIYNSKPSEVKLIMVDPKVVELSVYNGIPHLLIPVVTDPKKAAGALAWAVQEMDDRYNKFAEKGVRDLKGYNKAVEKEGTTGKLPQIVIIVDELADLMMVAAKDVEEAICRLAQKARAAGMHLVIATQRPSVDVITGLIKANVPSRIAFAVSSQIDSRTILDQVGAEKLLGKGDMLFFPSGASKPTRVQGAFVSDEEVEKIVEFVKSNGTAVYREDILDTIENGTKEEQKKNLEAEQQADDDIDPFLNEAIDTVVETGQASTSFIQRRFKVGYARAGRIIDQMEERGVISGYQGSKPREVLWTIEKLAEMKMASSAKEE